MEGAAFPLGCTWHQWGVVEEYLLIARFQGHHRRHGVSPNAESFQLSLLFLQLLQLLSGGSLKLLEGLGDLITLLGPTLQLQLFALQFLQPFLELKLFLQSPELMTALFEA